jgi:hypothetical protein
MKKVFASALLAAVMMIGFEASARTIYWTDDSCSNALAYARWSCENDYGIRSDVCQYAPVDHYETVAGQCRAFIVVP